jgi:hypothetical protein
LPILRLLVVFLMMGGFAVGFAELVRRSDALSARPLPTASQCGDTMGVPCPMPPPL